MQVGGGGFRRALNISSSWWRPLEVQETAFDFHMKSRGSAQLCKDLDLAPLRGEFQKETVQLRHINSRLQEL